MPDNIPEPKVVRMWQVMYVEMQADPADHRTDKEFCAEHDIDHGTFRHWKMKYRTYIFREVEALRKTYRNEYRNIGMRALMKKMAAGDTNAIKLHFQLLGDLVETQVIKTENMSDADKIRRIKSLSEEVVQREKLWTKAEGSGERSASTEEVGPKPSELRGSEPGTAN